MNDLEELKRKWQKIDIPVETGNISGSPSGGSEAPRSIRQRILRRLYRLMGVMCMGLLITPEFVTAFSAPCWFTISYVSYFVLAGIFNLILICRLQRADFASLTTIDAIDFVTRFTTLRNRFRMVMICCAVPVLAMMFLVLDHGNEPALLISGAAGAIVGIFLGIIINRRFSNELKLLKAHLGADEWS